MASSLSITNGDFENQTDSPYSYDIAYWYDYGGPGVERTTGPFFLNHISSITKTKVANMGSRANENPDGGNHAYVYQSIGMYDGYPPVVDIELDWGLASGKAPGMMGVGVQILESDGTFEPGEWDGAAHDIYGFIKTDQKPDNPVTLIGQGSVLRHAPASTVFHESFQIDLSSATIGKELFLRFNNIHGGGAVLPLIQVDNITLSPAYVVNRLPADGAIYVATERTSSENDLVFYVVDDTIIEVDILFGNDPNLYSDPVYKIVEGMPVTPGLNTVTLETELTEDLMWDTEYFWKVLAYESDGMGGRSLKYTGLATSFKTIQEGPLLFGVAPAVAGVWPGENVVFSVPSCVKTDTFQWYKEGNPNPLVEGAKYVGVDSNSLTILNVQPADEGTYYCVGTETATGLTAVTLSPGVLFIKELKAYYPFETTYTAGGNLYTPDIKGGKDMQLMGGAGLSDEYSLIDKNLLLVNPSGAKLQWARILDTTVAHYEDITIACWVRPTTLINSNDRDRWNRVWDFGDNANEAFFLTMLYRQDDPRQGGLDVARSEWNWYTIEDGQSVRHNRELDVESEIDPEVWHYVVVTVEDGYGRIYLNGECGTENKSPQGLTLQSPIDFKKTYNYIGKAVGADVPYLNARIDDFRIYNYALTKQEIAEEYNRVTGVESICDLEVYDLYDWDLNRNCKIDLPDFAEIAGKWLVDYRIFPD